MYIYSYIHVCTPSPHTEVTFRWATVPEHGLWKIRMLAKTPWADPESRSTSKFCKLHLRSTSRLGGSTFGSSQGFGIYQGERG